MNSDTAKPSPQATYKYSWGPRWWNVLGGGFSRKGEPCRIIARGKMNSALVEFADGFRAIISRNAIRRVND